MAERASVRSFCWLADKALFISHVLVVVALMNAFLASLTLLELRRLFTLLQQMLVVGFNLDNLAAVLALSQHHTVFPEMKVKILCLFECLIKPATELALRVFILLASSRLLCL